MHFFFFSSRRRHTRLQGDWSSDVCSSDLFAVCGMMPGKGEGGRGRLIVTQDAVEGHLGSADLNAGAAGDRKSTRLNSSHLVISYAVFCLKKKKKHNKKEHRDRSMKELKHAEID